MKKSSFDDYIKGNRRGIDARDIERKSLSDPFLADAIDGFDSVDSDHNENIGKLKRLVRERSKTSKKYSLTTSMYWKATAVCVILCFFIGGGYLIMLDERNNNKQYSIASSNSESIELYIPQKYLEKKDILVMEGKGLSVHPVENIENLEELNIEKDIFIYLPENYPNLKKREVLNIK